MTMRERLTEDKLAGLATTVSEGSRYTGSKIEVAPETLGALVAEVQDRRLDEREGADAFSSLHDWLLKWADTEQAARAAHAAWIDSMARQHRDVSRHLARWEILETQDQALYMLIAAHFIQTALDTPGRGEPDA